MAFYCFFHCNICITFSINAFCILVNGQSHAKLSVVNYITFTLLIFGNYNFSLIYSFYPPFFFSFFVLKFKFSNHKFLRILNKLQFLSRYFIQFLRPRKLFCYTHSYPFVPESRTTLLRLEKIVAGFVHLMVINCKIIIVQYSTRLCGVFFITY